MMEKTLILKHISRMLCLLISYSKFTRTDKIALLKRFCGNDTIIVEVQIFKGHDLYGRKYKENTKAERKCYRERKQDRNGSHLVAAAPVLFPYFVRNLFPAII